MLEIKLATIDNLNKLVSDLDVLTYLRDMVLYDLQNDISTIKEKQTKVSAEHYLFQRQIETVNKLNETVFSQNFAVNIKAELSSL